MYGVLSLRAAALLLTRADSFRALRLLAPKLGFTSGPTSIPPRIISEMELQDLVASTEIFESNGQLRLFSAELTPPDSLQAAHDIRHQTKQVAHALLRHAPARHWCLITISASKLSLCIATAHHSSRGPVIAALTVDRRRILDSDADTLRALADASTQDHNIRHARFTDILKRDALSIRFYRALEQQVNQLATSLSFQQHHPSTHSRSTATLKRSSYKKSTTPTSAQRRELALICVSRCVFLGFLEAKGWLNGQRDFLVHNLLLSLESGNSLHNQLLRPLFFGTLNTPTKSRSAEARRFGKVPFLNGGLFAPTQLERINRQFAFSNDAISSLITNVLDRFRFTAREDSTSWSEAAVDPEMLGRTFEGLMASDERRRTGAFYTPADLVNTSITEALIAFLPEIPAPLLTHDVTDRLPHRLSQIALTRIRHARVLDPACGSGAFLVRILERFDNLLLRSGDASSSHERRKTILTHSIFGIDRDPIAVWLCELRLWLSVVIEYNTDNIASIPPLPNIDHNIRVGDSLAGGDFHNAPLSRNSLSKLRLRYSRASGARKASIALALDNEERRQSIGEISGRIELIKHERTLMLRALRNRDLFGQRRAKSQRDTRHLNTLRTTAKELTSQRYRLQLGAALPFRFATMFADIAAEGGFHLIVGNPPWVRPHALNHNDRIKLREDFFAMKHASWKTGASRAGAGNGFAAQADLAVAFIERSIHLLAPNGIIALLVPAKLWRNLSGGGVRQLLLQHTKLLSLHDWSDAPAQFEAATYPSLIVAAKTDVNRPHYSTDTPLLKSQHSLPERNNSARSSPVHITLVRSDRQQFPAHPDTLSLDGSQGAPWLLLPPQQHSAFHLLRQAGTPLTHTTLGRPLLGVKCGCNSAFLVHATEHDDGSATVTSLCRDEPRQAVIEREVLRPALKGEQIKHQQLLHDSTRDLQPSNQERDLRIIWTHGLDGMPLGSLPPATARWLAHWRSRLCARADARHRKTWWSLFRTEAARADCPRLVWADIGKRLRVQMLQEGDPTVPLNTCYVLRLSNEAEAYALSALIQSNITGAWLDALAEPARGGFRRFLGWTVASLPIPQDWTRAMSLLTPLGRRLQNHSVLTSVSQQELDNAVADAYKLNLKQLRPLLDWYCNDRP